MIQALSIVAPNGQKISSGLKSIEVRRWQPSSLLQNLLIVENQNYLSEDHQEEMGLAICVVDIQAYRPWHKNEIEVACATYWEAGWTAWELINIRPLKPFPVIAKRKIYEIPELKIEQLVYVEHE